MKNDRIHRLPPPPLFTIRPPPKPPGSLFENFDTVKIFNGQCLRTSLDSLSPLPTRIDQKTDQSPTWLNLFLLILLVISVISCIIIVIFIFICLRKLRKEEKQYKDYLTSGSLSFKSHRHTCTRTSEHYKCTSNRFHCCDDYYSQQLMPMTRTSSSHHNITKSSQNPPPSSSSINEQDTPQNHQYECIPEYLLTMTRQRHYQPHQFNGTCGGAYSNFSRLYLTPQEATTNTSDGSQCTCSPPPSASVTQEESSAPLLAATMSKESHRRDESSSMIEWTKKSLFS